MINKCQFPFKTKRNLLGNDLNRKKIRNKDCVSENEKLKETGKFELKNMTFKKYFL